ncbi:MAG: hypothetical protein QOJ99_5572 [Bryobacterales bacterium]|jgi:hypothetical protein|nr:hypothetical protein [Bryobacterales bacterium]
MIHQVEHNLPGRHIELVALQVPVWDPHGPVIRHPGPIGPTSVQRWPGIGQSGNIRGRLQLRNLNFTVALNTPKPNFFAQVNMLKDRNVSRRMLSHCSEHQIVRPFHECEMLAARISEIGSHLY